MLFAEFQVVVDRFPERGLKTVDIRSFEGDEGTNEVDASMEHPVFVTVLDRTRMSPVVQHAIHIKPSFARTSVSDQWHGPSSD